MTPIFHKYLYTAEINGLTVATYEDGDGYRLVVEHFNGGMVQGFVQGYVTHAELNGRTIGEAFGADESRSERAALIEVLESLRGEANKRTFSKGRYATYQFPVFAAIVRTPAGALTRRTDKLLAPKVYKSGPRAKSAVC